jgi:hypothetical protein
MAIFALDVWVTREFPRGFTHVLKGDFVNPQSATQGATDLFCYDRGTGVGSFFATVRQGKLDNGTPVVDGPRKIGINHTFGNRWTHIVYVPVTKLIPQPFPRPPKKEFVPLFFFYDASTGVAQVDRLDGLGDMALKKRHTGLRTTWTKIIFGRFGRANLLFYDARNGVGEFHTLDDAGELRLVRSFTGFRTSWHTILAGNFGSSSNDDLLFYDRGAGIGEFYKVADDARITLFSQHTNWRHSWDQIVAGQFQPNSAFDGLLFYEGVSTFHTEFYSTNGSGGISQIDVRFQSNWRLPWQAINTGEFTPNIGIVGTSRMCNYDSRDGAIRYFFIKPAP